MDKLTVGLVASLVVTACSPSKVGTALYLPNSEANELRYTIVKMDIDWHFKGEAVARRVMRDGVLTNAEYDEVIRADQRPSAKDALNAALRARSSMQGNQS